MKKLFYIFSLIVLLSFTSVTVFLALLFGGACVYYYEPNWFVWATEVVLGIVSLVGGTVLLLDLLFEKVYLTEYQMLALAMLILGFIMLLLFVLISRNI